MRRLISLSPELAIRAATVSFQLRPAGSRVRFRQLVWTRDWCRPGERPAENRSRSNQTRPQAVPSTPAALWTASVPEDFVGFPQPAISKVRDAPSDTR